MLRISRRSNVGRVSSDSLPARGVLAVVIGESVIILGDFGEAGSWMPDVIVT